MFNKACTLLLGWTMLAWLTFAGMAVADEKEQLSNETDSATANPWIIQYQYGFASDADFGPSLLFLVDESRERTRLHSFSIGKLISDTFYGRDIDVSAHLGVQYFEERGFQDDIAGITGYWRLAKSTYLPFTRLPIKISLAQGLSYVSNIPTAEARDFEPANSEKFTHYLEYGLHYSFRNQLANSNSPFSPLSRWFRDVNLGYTIYHRSSVFGLFAETGGGINFPGIAVEFILK